MLVFSSLLEPVPTGRLSPGLGKRANAIALA